MIVAANWKLNKTPGESADFLKKFLEIVSGDEQKQFIIFPPAINLTTLKDFLENTQVGWGLQNIYSETSGAFTGENSAEVAKSLGSTHVLIGHSERRSLFLETDQLIAKKVQLAQSLDLQPMLCLGENLEERQTGKTNDVILQQLRDGLSLVDYQKPLQIAYEPVWAIGTGEVASPEQASEAHGVLRAELVNLAGAEVAERTPILYGGSVKPGNVSELSKKDNIDGFLVGGASLKPESFVDIYKNSL